MNKRSSDLIERQRAIVQESKLFDAEYYLRAYSDLAKSGLDPLSHYMEFGASQERNPNLLFDEAYYIWQCPEVLKSGSCSLLHYILKGWNRFNPHPLFDTAFYLSEYPEVSSYNLTPLAHFLNEGMENGYVPCKEFDLAFYLKQDPELAKSGLTPFRHFLEEGAWYGYDPCEAFDTSFYLRQDPKIAVSGENPLSHYRRLGRNEGRWSRNPFLDSLSVEAIEGYATLCKIEALLPLPETLSDLILVRPLNQSKAGQAYKRLAAKLSSEIRHLILAGKPEAKLFSFLDQVQRERAGSWTEVALIFTDVDADEYLTKSAALPGLVSASMVVPEAELSFPDKLKVLMRLIIQLEPEKTYNFGSAVARQAILDYRKQLNYCTSLIDMD